VQRPQIRFIKLRAFNQILSTTLRLTCRVSRVLKRQNSSREVISTNLAHTAQYCLITAFKTMAERYHKRSFQNSTLVLPHLSASRLTQQDYGWGATNGTKYADPTLNLLIL
jgi:hypothetical protein